MFLSGGRSLHFELPYGTVRREAFEVEVIHGRLREKKKAKIAKNAIGIVEGVTADGKAIVVKVSAIVAGDKSKDISFNVSPDILEPVKEREAKAKDDSVDLVGGKKALSFLNADGGKTVQVTIFVW